MSDPKIPLTAQLRLNAIKDPQELADIAITHQNPEVCKAAIDKLINMDLIEDRKALLVCYIVKNTNDEPIAKHAFDYCLSSKLPIDVKCQLMKRSINKIKFESVRKQMQKWLDEMEWLDKHK